VRKHVGELAGNPRDPHRGRNGAADAEREVDIGHGLDSLLPNEVANPLLLPIVERYAPRFVGLLALAALPRPLRTRLGPPGLRRLRTLLLVLPLLRLSGARLRLSTRDRCILLLSRALLLLIGFLLRRPCALLTVG
jgi:hypothetical protein